jgi:ubiquinone/menaquinone biosynthesis C-methylase UbiE
MMNLFHRWYCKYAGWRRIVETGIVPTVLGDLDLGENPLEIGPGPGLTTDVIRRRVPKLTALELDHKLATSLADRMEGTNVKVVEGDATAMPFPDEFFTAGICLTMLHHVPNAGLQDRLLREMYRVLQPGAVFVGSDSTPSLRWNIYHLFDTRCPVDPAQYPARLQAAGFERIEVDLRDGGGGFRWRAWKPT